VAAELRDRGDLDAELTAIAVLGRIAWTRQDLGPLGAEIAARVNELAPTGHPRARALAALVRAMVADVAGDDRAMLAALDAIEPRMLDPFWEAMARWMGGLVRLDQGDPDAAQAILGRVERSTDPAVRAILGGLQVRILWSRGRIDEALRQVPAVLADVQATGATVLTQYAMANAALIYAHVGELDAARRSLAGAGPTTEPRPESSAARTLLAGAAVHLAAGDEAAATAGIRRALSLRGGELGKGTERRMWRHLLPLSYVLVPEIRSHWDGLPLRGYLVTARELARAVVAVREGRSVAAVAELDVSDVDRVRSGG
jgi:hypothetical protein